MRVFTFYFLLFTFFLCSTSLADLHTSVKSGDWSAVDTWDSDPNPVPVDGDTFAIAAGHTVVMDVDQSGFANGMGASTIAATATLISETAAGDYYLKMNGDLTLTGTLQAGTSVSVPLPAATTFTAGFNSGSNSIVVNNTTGVLNLWCDEPTIKYVSTTQQDVAGQKVLTVDTDISSDWSVGDIIAICDLLGPGIAKDNEEDTIASMTSNTITCTNNLDANKEEGAKIILISRNIRLINSTDYVVKNGRSCYIAAETYNCTGSGFYATSNGTMAGSYLCPAGEADFALVLCNNITFDMVIASISTVTNFGIYNSRNVTTTSESIIAGFYYGVSACEVVTFNGIVAACHKGITASNVIINGDIIGCYDGINGTSIILYGDIANVTNCFNVSANNFLVANNEMGKSIGGITSTNVCIRNANGVFFNTLFSATTEFSGYNNALYRAKNSYIASYDHDQVQNAFKAWCLGGIVTSQTGSPPTGHIIWYEHACEDDTTVYPCFRQYETVVQPGTAIEVEGYIRIADGENLTTDPPALQIVDKFADPLVDSTASYLDECEIPTPSGDATWQAVDVIWANTGDSPRTVIVRMYASVADVGADVDVDEVWSIADYKDQINETLKRVKRISAGSEF